MNTLFPLCRLAVGQVGIVREISATGALRRRLQDLGIVTGRRICCLHRSLAGDPAAFGVCHAVFALRDQDAVLVLVEAGEEQRWN